MIRRVEGANERSRAHRRRRRVQVRRRQVALVAAAAAAFLGGLALGAGGQEPTTPAGRESSGGDGGAPPAEPPVPAVDRLTLEQQVGRMVILRFAGTEPPGYVQRALRDGRAAGAILFRDNVVDPAQLRRLTRALRARLTKARAADLRRPGGRGGPHRAVGRARAVRARAAGLGHGARGRRGRRPRPALRRRVA